LRLPEPTKATLLFLSRTVSGTSARKDPEIDGAAEDHQGAQGPAEGSADVLQRRYQSSNSVYYTTHVHAYKLQFQTEQKKEKRRRRRRTRSSKFEILFLNSGSTGCL
jgi:hypothetical protein